MRSKPKNAGKTQIKMKHIQEALNAFVASPHLRVAILKGPWGVGKTFFWKNFWESHRALFKFRAYSYVSLFGVKDIGGVKQKILSNFETLDQEGLTKHLQKLGPLSGILKSLKIPLLNPSTAVTDIIEEKLIENFLICFDDLERKETSFSVSSFLGLVSQLKEQKACKIILILNETELDENSQKQINEYHEKVVDIDLTYDPSIEDNLAIVWPDGCEQMVADLFRNVGLKNIRVMQRVKWTVDYFEKSIAKRFPNLWAPFRRKCATLAILHSAYSTQLTLKEIIGSNYWELIFSDEKGNDKPETDRFKILKKFDFSSKDEDELIADYILNGHTVVEAWDKILQARDDKIRIGDVDDRHRKIWEMYLNGFVTTQTEFIELQCEFLRQHVEDLRLRDVASTIQFINELDPSIDLKHLLDRSIERFIESQNVHGIDDLRPSKLSPEVLKLIREKVSEKTPQLSMKELFVELAGSNGWNPSDIKFLLRFSQEDYYQWITTEDQVDVISLLTEFLSRFGRDDDNEKEVVKNIKEALRRVRGRSLIDKFRVDRLIELKE